MAQPVTKPIIQPAHLSWGRLMRLIRRPTPGRLGTTLRMTVACLFGILVGETWQIPAMVLIPILIAGVWQEDRMMNLQTGKTLIIFFTFSSLLTYLGAMLRVNNYFMVLFINLVLSFLFLFLGSASKLKFIGIVCGVILSYLLLTLDSVSNGDAITRFILYSWWDIMIAALVIIVFGLLISPSPRHILMASIAYRLRLAARLLRTPHETVLNEEVHDVLHQGTSGMLSKIALATKEKLWSSHDLNCLRQSALHSFALLTLSDSMARHHLTSHQREKNQLADLLDDMAHCFDEDSYPKNITPPAIENPILDRMCTMMARFSAPSEETLPPTPPPPQFFLPDAFTNFDHVRFAVRSTIAVLISIVTYKALNWPGIHTCVVTCFVVSLPTIGEMRDKQNLRIIGSLIGCGAAMLGIIFILQHFTNIAQLLLMIGCVLTISGWIKYGDNRISYAGLQIMLAFFLSDLTHFTPASDLTVPRDRVIGILIGLFITFVVYTHFWPNSASKALDGQLQRIKNLLHKEHEASTELERIVLASRAQELIGATEQTLYYAMLEPPYFRPSRQQCATYRTHLRQATALMENLLTFPLPKDHTPEALQHFIAPSPHAQ